MSSDKLALSATAKNRIGQWLAKEMNAAVRNGANSVSMPDELVEIAVWLHEAEKQAGPVARAHVRSVTPGRIDELDVLRPLPQGTHLLYAAPVQASAVGAEPVRYPHPDEDDPVTLWKEIRRLRAAMSQAGPVAGLIGKMTAQRAKFFLMRFRQEEAMLGPNEQAALSYAVSALEREQYAAPPSPLTEQDKEDAELFRFLEARTHWDDERDMGPGGRWWLAVLVKEGRPSFREAIRAARAKR